MSLRAKLVLGLVCLTAVAAGAVGLLSYRSTATQLNSELDGSLETAVREALVLGVTGPRVRPVPPARLRGIHVQYVSPDGSVRSGDAAVDIPVDDADLVLAGEERRGEEAFRDASVDGEPMRVLTVSAGNGRGAVQGARSLDETNRVLASLRTRILVVTLAVVGVAALVGVVIADSITRRLLRLTRVAEAVAVSGAPVAHASGEQDQRAPGAGLSHGPGVPQEGSDEVARLGVAFNEMLAALSRSQQEQARLVQDAGHELRTPMTSLRANVFSLRSLDGLDEAGRRAVIEDLEGETEELSRLIEEVLVLAAGETTREARTAVDLPELVRSEAERTGRRWNRSVRVVAPSPAPGTGGEPVPGGSPIVVDAGEEQLARAVRNLVDNAAKFSPHDSPIEVVVSRVHGPDGRGPGASVEVRDRGPGFDEADLEAAFGRFHRSQAARALPGSGLGLAIVAAVAESHGGAVRAANRPDGGACVTLWLPASPQ